MGTVGLNILRNYICFGQSGIRIILVDGVGNILVLSELDSLILLIVGILKHTDDSLISSIVGNNQHLTVG